MACLNLLIWYRADHDWADEYKKDTDTADNWVQKALATRRSRTTVSRSPPRGITNDVLK
jgi:hypothetical protein